MNEEGRFDIRSLRMGVIALGEMIERFRKKRGGEILKPIGDWPENWLDDIHEFDRHGVDDLSAGREGEIILKREVGRLYLQNGVEGAVDDVSGATLSPDMVRAR